MLLYTEKQKAEQIRNLVDELGSQEHLRSTNLRGDFAYILQNVGGIMTYEQAKKIVRDIDARALVIPKYKPENFFIQESGADRLAVSSETNIICAGKTVSLKYDPTILWGLGYVFNECHSLDDYLSVTVDKTVNRSISYATNGNYYKLIFMSYNKVPEVMRSIAQNEELLSGMFGNIESLRPIYVIFITETDKDLIDLALDRLSELELTLNHKVVTVSGGWRDLKCDYTEYEMLQ